MKASMGKDGKWKGVPLTLLPPGNFRGRLCQESVQRRLSEMAASNELLRVFRVDHLLQTLPESWMHPQGLYRCRR